MKLINKNFMLLTFISALIFTACDDEITRDPSPVTNPSSTNVYFTKDNSSNPVLGIEQTSFDVQISREKADKEQTVTLFAENAYDDIFNVPSSVTFAAGESNKNVTIKVTDKMELMKSYHLAIYVDGEQVSLYKEQSVVGGDKKIFISSDRIECYKRRLCTLCQRNLL